MIAASAMGDTHINIFGCANGGKEKALGER